MRYLFILFLISAAISLEIYLLWPPNLSQTLNITPGFKFKVIDNYSTTFSCVLYIDNLPYGKNDSVVNDTETVIVANDTLDLGDHIWYVNCTNGSVYNISETRIIGIGENFSRCAVLIDNNASYYLVNDIINTSLDVCIDIRGDNITLDCKNHLIDGEMVAGSIGITSGKSARVKDCSIREFMYGAIVDTPGVNFENVSVESFNVGLFISPVQDSYFYKLQVKGVGYGIKIEESVNITLEDLYIEGTGEIEGIYIFSGSEITIKNFTIKYFSVGVDVIYSDEIVMEDFYLYTSPVGSGEGGSVIEGTITGIYLSNSSNALMRNFTIENSMVGIELHSGNNTIEGCKLFNDDKAIDLFSSNNVIEGCEIINNGVAIYTAEGFNNTVKNSKIENNSYGIFFDGVEPGCDLKVYNNLFNNSVNIHFDGYVCANYWNTTKREGSNIVGGLYIGGNYWGYPNGTGFSDTCSDNNEDGFCDDVYEIATDNIDFLPLTMWHPDEITKYSSPNVIQSKFSILSPYSIIFYFEYQDFFRFYFDYGGKNFSLSFFNNSFEIGKDIYLLYSGRYPMKSGVISIECYQNLLIKINGKEYLIKENCLGGSIRFECERCKIGPIGVIGKIS